MVLVYSLLEMQMNKSVIKRMMRSLSVDILKKNLGKIYFKYKMTYGKHFVMESLKHVS